MQISYIYLLGIALVYLLTHTLEHLSTFNTTWALQHTCRSIICPEGFLEIDCCPFCLTNLACLKGLISSGFLFLMWDCCCTELAALHIRRGKVGMRISDNIVFRRVKVLEAEKRRIAFQKSQLKQLLTQKTIAKKMMHMPSKVDIAHCFLIFERWTTARSLWDDTATLGSKASKTQAQWQACHQQSLKPHGKK